MSRRRQPGKNSRKRRSDPFVENGILMLFLAGAFWLASVMLSSNPMLATVGSTLRSILWLPALIGLGLLGVHVVLRMGLARSPNNVDSPATRSSPPEPALTIKTGTTPQEQPRWSPEVFAAIEWRRFEAVVEALFAQAGFETRSQPHGADGGVDIWLHSKNAEGPVSVVQCKHWQGKPVTVKEMREFLGVMVSKGLQRGTYATTSRYTADALEFAKANGINAQDGASLLKLIAQRTPEQQARLLEVAYEGEYWKPTCASCGVKMTERTSGKDGNRFWGCVNYPRCKRTLAMKVG
jgi:restriction system protein